MRSIFEYTDYRQFIREFYSERKKETPRFSYQAFSLRAGMKSKSYLYEVISGKRALSKSKIFSVATAMGLPKAEIPYFEALVHFNHAESLKEREYYFGRMQILGKSHPVVALRQDRFTYFSDWYNVVLRELVTMKVFQDDWEALAKAVSPPITPVQAENAVKLLLSLGLLRKKGVGRYELSDKVLSTGEYSERLFVHRFQKSTMNLAQQSIDRHPKEVRDISTLTLGLSRKGFARIREELKEFRKYAAEIATTDDPAERVFQMNIQFFPVSAQVCTNDSDSK